MILVLLTGDFAHCIHPSPSFGELQLTEESEVKVRWAGYFERLYQADPPAVELDVKGVTIPVADPPINCGPPSFVETQAAVNRLKWVKLLGSVVSLLSFSTLVEMLYSCRCMHFCALPGTQASSQLIGRGPCCPSLEREG